MRKKTLSKSTLTHTLLYLPRNISLVESSAIVVSTNDNLGVNITRSIFTCSQSDHIVAMPTECVMNKRVVISSLMKSLNGKVRLQQSMGGSPIIILL